MSSLLPRLSFPRRVRRLAMVLALAFGAPAAFAQSPGDPPAAASPGPVAAPEAAPAVSALNGRIVYEFLLAEIAGARGNLGLSSRLYLDLARGTRDARIARRATEISLHARDTESAAEAARLWSESDPASVDARRVLAGLLAGSSLEASQIQFARILALSDTSALPQTLMGLNRAFAGIRDKESVASSVRWLTEPYLDWAEAHFARAQAAFAANDMGRAAEDADAALKLYPDWEPAVVLKAEAMRTTLPSVTIAVLEDYLGRHPEARDARLALARTQITAKQLPAARQNFERLLAVNPEDVELRYAAGLIALDLRDFDAAVMHLERALATMPPQPDALRVYLGMAEAGRGNQEKARAWYREVRDDPAQVFQARLRIAESLAKEGRFDEARASLKDVHAEDAEARLRIRLLEAQLLRDANRPREALALLDEELARQPDQFDLLYESAMLAERAGDLDDMERRLRRVIAQQPDNGHAYNALGYALADRGVRLEEAEQLIDRALALTPDDPYILDSKGWVRFKRGDARGAEEVLRRALAMNPDAEIAAHLGEVLWSQGRHDEARSIWAEALKAHPGHEVLRKAVERLDRP